MNIIEMINSTDIWNIVLTTFLSAIVLFILTKLMGHKQVAELDIYDYITGITIGSIGAELATELEDPWKPLTAMVVFGLITVSLSLLTQKIFRTGKFINGSPTIIMDGGKLFRENMKKAHLDLSEFLLMCRQAGYFNLNDIQTAVFEYTGKLSVLPVSAKRPATPSDMNLAPAQEFILTEVIMDGRVLDKNLKLLGLDAAWLDEQVKAQGYAATKDVFLGQCDGNHALTLYAGE